MGRQRPKTYLDSVCELAEAVEKLKKQVISESLLGRILLSPWFLPLIIGGVLFIVLLYVLNILSVVYGIDIPNWMRWVE